MQPLRPISYANVMSTIAVFLALATGGAYAADTVFSTDIVDGEVKNADLAPDAVSTSKILAGAVFNSDLAPSVVTGAKVKDDTLSGADVDETTLGTVPQASNAQTVGNRNAATTGGQLLINRSVSCDPASTTFTTCGAVFEVNLPANSDLLVTLTAGWAGSGLGADEGKCRLVVEGEALGPLSAFGQDGNEHPGSARAAILSLAFGFDDVTSGPHDVQLSCQETDGDVQVSAGTVTVVRLGTG